MLSIYREFISLNDNTEDVKHLHGLFVWCLIKKL